MLNGDSRCDRYTLPTVAAISGSMGGWSFVISNRIRIDVVGAFAVAAKNAAIPTIA